MGTPRFVASVLAVQTLLIGAIAAIVALSLFGPPGIGRNTPSAAPTPYCQAFRAVDEGGDVPGPFDYRQFYDRLPPAKGLGATGGFATDPEAIGCPPGYILQR